MSSNWETPQDRARVAPQRTAVFQLMSDNRWWTIDDLASAVTDIISKHVTSQSISARIRDLRKTQYGGHTVNRQRSKSSLGLYYYQLIENNREMPTRQTNLFGTLNP